MPPDNDELTVTASVTPLKIIFLNLSLMDILSPTSVDSRLIKEIENYHLV